MKRLTGSGLRLFALAVIVVSICACRASESSRPADVPPEDTRASHGGEWFVQTGCTSCHPITVYGVWNPAVSAPDLSTAVEDVPKRFGRSLEDFLGTPPGTMAMVLSSRIPLDDAGRAMAAAKLKEAYALHRERNGAAKPVASH